MCELERTACLEQANITKKYHGKCDPCHEVVCPGGGKCQIDVFTRRPVCKCVSACLSEFEPLCASDGHTYINDCVMKENACIKQLDIVVLFKGECSSGTNPCANVHCGLHELCQIDTHGRAFCTCQPPCAPIYTPVCSEGGVTYDSQCHLEREVCLQRKSDRVKHSGVCNKKNACMSHKCQTGAVCQLRNEEAYCECQSCTHEYQPVCGSDNITYSNECKLKLEACNLSQNITVLAQGVCDPCRKVTCAFHGICERDKKGGSKCVCPNNCQHKETAKICASDGRTYRNLCEMKYKSCHIQQKISSMHNGTCVAADMCVGVRCRHGGQCVHGRCTCNFTCTFETHKSAQEERVCGSDGNTYPTECLMRRSMCTRRIDVAVLHEGDCDDGSGSGDLETALNNHPSCDVSSCKFGGVCVKTKHGYSKCLCTFNCGAVRAPVCGSNGRSYGNECQMREEMCRKQTNIHIQPMENCDDIFEEFCDGQTPLLNATSKEEMSCDTSDDCPAASYCHKLFRAGKCCAEDCGESIHGCCEDGKTKAKGPNMKGCPSLSEKCSCNQLGSNGTDCDTKTMTCFCKMGVGGPKCDRCLPNFWGLSKISQGNQGCLPCNCNEHGSMREDCEQMTGRCVCRPGIAGQKCDICSNGKKLVANGCTDYMQNDVATQTRSCYEKVCYFGAQCRINKQGYAECVCPASCPSDLHLPLMGGYSLLVCGSDGQTYGSPCQLDLFACRLQKNLTLFDFGPCAKMEGYFTKSKFSPTLRPQIGTSKFKARAMRVAKENTNKIIGIVGDDCLDHVDCWNSKGVCLGQRCACPAHTAVENSSCNARSGVIPSFRGDGLIVLKRSISLTREFKLKMVFRSASSNGILAYFHLNGNGSGDFASIAINRDYLEFRYDLGSGPTTIRSRDRITLKRWHHLEAQRSDKDGSLLVDNGSPVVGVSPGVHKSLNVEKHFYLGGVVNNTKSMLKNIGVYSGLNGCIESLELHSKDGNTIYEFKKNPSHLVDRRINIGDCINNACKDKPCLNNGTCLDLGDDFYCHCNHGYAGGQCNQKVVKHTQCDSSPCHRGATCVPKEDGTYTCRCRAGTHGARCERG